MKKTNKTDHFMTHDEVLKELMQDPEFKKEWDNLEPQFAMECALIELRMQCDETQQKLADKMATKHGYISRVESGAVSPTVNYIAKMADALNADAEIVFRPRGTKKIIRAVLVKETKGKYKAK